jgi:transcriptional regulator with XRE-family HTH domain
MPPKKWQDDPLVSVRGERLRAALELAGLTVSEAARRMGVSQPRLHQMISGNARCRASVLLKFARLVRVSDEWLSGRVMWLPGSRASEQRLLSNARSGLLLVCSRLEWLLEEVRNGRRVSKRSLELRDLRAACRAIYELFDERYAELPRRVREPSELGKELRKHIGAVLPLLNAPTRHRAALTTQLGALRILEQGLPYYWPERPARAELAEHSLRAACHGRWLEEAQNEYPGFDPRQQLSFDEQRGRYVMPAPWPAMLAMDSILEALLTPEVWRAHLLKGWRGDKMPSPSPEEAEEMTVALARVLRLVLEPWFRGLAHLDVEGLSALVPRLWRRTLMARGSSASPERIEWDQD